MLLCATMVLSLYSCSDDETFDYPMEILYGKWEGTGIYYEGEWIDLSNWMYQELSFSIRFNEDGTYYGEGFFLMIGRRDRSTPLAGAPLQPLEYFSIMPK